RTIYAAIAPTSHTTRNPGSPARLGTRRRITAKVEPVFIPPKYIDPDRTPLRNTLHPTLE
ncbi:MAG: hypothetical protein ACRDQ5_27750, partial [Sciscionella sp.]